MEINKFTDIMGVVVKTDIVEGRMVKLTSHSENYNFGSKVDLPGVKLPADATEAKSCKYIVTWPVSKANAEGAIKMFITQPSFPWAMRRGGWDQAANVPFSADVHLTYPGNRDGVTIPSGYQALAYDRGVFTVPSGSFAYSADIEVPGAPLEVLNTADDGSGEAGKLAYNSGSADATVAVVEHYDSTDAKLTFRTL